MTSKVQPKPCAESQPPIDQTIPLFCVRGGPEAPPTLSLEAETVPHWPSRIRFLPAQGIPADRYQKMWMLGRD